MNVLIFTHGSRGDVQPFAALAAALDDAGHHAILCAPKSSVLLPTHSGVELIPLTEDLGKWMTEPEVLEAAESNYRGLSGKRILLQVVRKVRGMMATVLDEMAYIAIELHDTGTRIDAVVHHVDLPAHEIAEMLRVPAIPVCLQPSWVPTSSFPNPEVPFTIPKVLNRLSYTTTRLRLRTFTGNTSSWRSNSLKLPRRRGHQNFLRTPGGKQSTIIQAFSRHLLPSQLNYPAQVHTSGFWFTPRVETQVPSNGLRSFLQTGPTPVYIGFGSMVGTSPERTSNLIVDAVERTGIRAVVVTGWGGIKETKNDNIFYLKQAPFDWLFPKVAAIIHHGGSGTTGIALVAGRPQVVCPFLPDQRYFGNRIHARGVGPEPIPQRALDASRLSMSIQSALGESHFAENADELAAQIRLEDGVRTAVKIIESVTSRD
ncbi:glycosyltransferase [Amycolatopsis sp. GM8]|uniref:glycosyltransferase n=1 Tax=Amycolatopsis sp. GM8 TaxID=2896530 RepID=UPI001F2495CF|nr:glycosyltransferase [Amycolatopsis sp. GM8]